MPRSEFRVSIILIPILAFIISCAKVSAPTGGPKDILPPVVTGTLPENGAKNYTGNRITITFNEYVTLDKINEKLMISPPLKKRPEVLIRGKNVIIDFDEELRDSTTYTFYFGDAIRDLNEGNIINDYQFVFSTGSMIDSLSISGNVLTSFSLDPSEGALVLLHNDLSDSAVMKDLPVYITKTNKEGFFRINNIKEGTYRLYALKDADNSKTFNLADEEFAFYERQIEITPDENYFPPVKDSTAVAPGTTAAPDSTANKGEYDLFLFQHEKKMHYLTSSSRNSSWQLLYTLSLPPDPGDFNFTIPEAAPGSFYLERSRENDTLLVWITDSTLYSKQEINTLVEYPFTDSTSAVSQKTDTIIMRFLVPRVPARVKVKPVPYKVLSGFGSGSLRPGQKIIFRSETPFREPDTSRIEFYEIVENKRIRQPYSFGKDSTNSCKLIFNASIVQGKNYLFIADSAAFGSIYGELSDSTGVRFNVRNNESFGAVLLNINNFEGSVIVQLLTNQDKPVAGMILKKAEKAEFKLLDKGIYRARIIYDSNNDGKWTTGDFMTGREPEAVSFLPQEIEVKENWNFDNDWDVSRKNIKALKKPAR